MHEERKKEVTKILLERFDDIITDVVNRRDDGSHSSDEMVEEIIIDIKDS